jgi:signal transduction histidine kinase
MQDTQSKTAGVSMAQLLAAFDGLGAHVCILDQHGKVRWVNEPWRRFASENELAPASCCEGTDYLGACGPARTPDDERVNGGLRQVIAGESAEFTCDYPCHSPTEPRWFQLVARSFRSDDGTRGTIVVHSDITARVLAEQERSAMQRNLLQLQRMESLGTCARGIAHDFNNVLTTLVGNLELARMHTLPKAPTHELLAEMTHAVDRARSLATRLYDLTQARAPRPEPVPLRALADEVATLARASLPSTQKVVVDGDPALMVRVDRAQLRQLLLNLCSNAADALAGRAGTMAISLRRERQALVPGRHEHEVDDFACIEVRDDGRGLTPEDCRRLFEPFHAPTYARQSSGLGLSVALAIAKSHGGTIAVTSEPGAGSSFRVSLPLASAAPIELPRPKPASLAQPKNG